MWERELAVCKETAVQAGKAILEIYEKDDGSEVTYKADQSPLTRADRASNAIIVEALKREFPDYAILSEEEKDDRKRIENVFCFVVDPLDGTKEYVKRNGQFTVNIALAYKTRSILGVIYVPVTGELYYAAEGKGSFLLTPDGKEQKLKVSDNTDHTKLRAVMSSSHGAPEMEALIEKYQIKELVRIGSSLKGCMVAKGDADVYFRHNPTMEWDTAAMQCIVEEAGGIFRQMDDSEMRYNRENSLNDKGFYAINKEENRLR